MIAIAATAPLPESAGTGPDPALPAPDVSLWPTTNPAKAEPWPQGTAPVAAAGLKVQRYAEGLDHPRWLYVLPNGDVLVAETNAPSVHDSNIGLKGIIQKQLMKKAGATVPSADRITRLSGVDANGAARSKSVFLQGLHSPFGMALVGDAFYVANTDALMRFTYRENASEITEPGARVVALPAGDLNHHWTKNLLASRDGTRLYVSVGSNSNIAENGIDNEKDRAAIHVVDLKTGVSRLFASGLRNPNGMDWQPQSGALWTTVNERDGLGDDLVPDYMTAVRDGAFYGWPYSYYGAHVDPRVKPPNPEKTAAALKPDYALGAHTASLGLAFYDADLLPPAYRGGAFIGQHGSWNRQPRSGYKVIFVPFANGQPSGPAQDVLTGFLGPKGQAYGRPVGVAVDKSGALLVADDVGNVVWRIVPAEAP